MVELKKFEVIEQILKLRENKVDFHRTIEELDLKNKKKPFLQGLLLQLETDIRSKTSKVVWSLEMVAELLRFLQIIY